MGLRNLTYLMGFVKAENVQYIPSIPRALVAQAERIKINLSALLTNSL